MDKKIIVRVDEELIEQLTKLFPETKGLPYSGRINVFLNKLLEQNRRDAKP